MTGENQETVTITLADLEALQRLAVIEAGHRILVGDFQKSRDHVDETLINIFDIVNSIPGKITECKDTLENDIENTYMSKSAAKLMESRFNSSVKSIKLWIVSSVTGATVAGTFAMWIFKIP